MGGCPVCGGTKRSPLAAGLWRCESVVTDHWTEMRPVHGAPPSLGWMAPAPFAAQRVCGHEYYEATELGGEMQFCAICDSNGAVGRCAIDHRMVCGYHSKMRDGRRVCDECVSRQEAAAAAAAAQAARDAANARAEAASRTLRTYLDQVHATCAALSGVKDPADRFLVLVLIAQEKSRHLAGVDFPEAQHAGAELNQILASAGRSLLGRDSALSWDASVDGAPSCAAKWAALIDRWYETGRLSRSMSVNLRLTSYRRKAFRSMPSRVTHGYIRGWQIDVGSPSNRIRPGYGEPGTPDTYVLADGTVGATAHRSHDLQANLNRSSVGPG